MLLSQEVKWQRLSIQVLAVHDADVISCPGVGQIKFSFDSHSYNIEKYCQNPTNDCVDVEVPRNTITSNRNLWDVHSCSVDSELSTFNMYDGFKTLYFSSVFYLETVGFVFSLMLAAAVNSMVKLSRSADSANAKLH